MNLHESCHLSTRYLLIVLLSFGLGSADAIEPDWTTYEQLLREHISPAVIDGVSLHQVDYARLARDPQFAEVIASLEAFDLRALEPGNETIAFYINAYNIFTLRLVVDHRPSDSIRDIGSFFRPVWKRSAGKLGDERISLDEIEHGRLRKLDEPRMHFAIVCASVSCPDLRLEAYRADVLDAQLDDQVSRFLSNADKGLRVDGRRVALSKIFRWFSEDFAASGGVLPFVGRYVPLPDDAALDSPLDYNWSLNGHW